MTDTSWQQHITWQPNQVSNTTGTQPNFSRTNVITINPWNWRWNNTACKCLLLQRMGRSSRKSDHKEAYLKIICKHYNTARRNISTLGPKPNQRVYQQQQLLTPCEVKVPIETLCNVEVSNYSAYCALLDILVHILHSAHKPVIVLEKSSWTHV